jgi:hypothetical protein
MSIGSSSGEARTVFYPRKSLYPIVQCPQAPSWGDFFGLAGNALVFVAVYTSSRA